MSKLKTFIKERILRVSLVKSQYSTVLHKMANSRRNDILVNSVTQPLIDNLIVDVMAHLGEEKASSSSPASMLATLRKEAEKAKTLSVQDKLKLDTPYGLLFKNEQDQWRVLAAVVKEDGELKKVVTEEKIPQGTYAFVRTDEVGFMRVRSVEEDGATHHRRLSHQAKQVRYSGKLSFELNEKKEAVLTSWDNDSGSYQPPAFLSFLAKLPKELFRTYNEEGAAHPPSPIPKSPVSPRSVLSSPVLLAPAPKKPLLLLKQNNDNTSTLNEGAQRDDVPRKVKSNSKGYPQRDLTMVSPCSLFSQKHALMVNTDITGTPTQERPLSVVAAH